MGSACLGMAAVAVGWGDVYYHMGLHCWDTAAGSLLVTEAGGCVRDSAGVCVHVCAFLKVCVDRGMFWACVDVIGVLVVWILREI